MPDTSFRQNPHRAATAVLAVYWVVLLLGTHWPQEIFPAEGQLLAGDKVLHFSAYSGLGFLLMLVARLRQSTVGFELPGVIGQLVRVGLLACVAGLLDEATQPIFGRDFEWYDWAADSAGGFFGAALALVVLRILAIGQAPAAQTEKT